MSTSVALPTTLKPWSYNRPVTNFEAQADIGKITTLVREKFLFEKKITREVSPRCTNKHKLLTYRLGIHEFTGTQAQGKGNHYKRMKKTKFVILTA